MRRVQAPSSRSLAVVTTQSGRTVTVADADLVGSSTLVAVTVQGPAMIGAV